MYSIWVNIQFALQMSNGVKTARFFAIADNLAS